MSRGILFALFWLLLVVGYPPSQAIIFFWNPTLDMRHGRGLAEIAHATLCGAWILGVGLAAGAVAGMVWLCLHLRWAS